MIVITLAFIYLTNYQYEGLAALSVNVISLTVLLFLIVLALGFIRTFWLLDQERKEKNSLAAQLVRNQQDTLLIRVNRKQVSIDLPQILWIESLSDYLKVHTQDQEYPTKERISKLEAILPDHFIRIHRSYIVNKHHVTFFSSDSLRLANQELPISRKYREETKRLLSK